MAFGGFKGSLVGGNNSIPNPLPATGSVSVAIGDLIVAVIAQQTANTSTAVTDNLTNTYTAQNAGTLATISGRMYYSRATFAGTLTTVNFATTASANDASCSVAVYEGPFVTSPLDVTPANLSADLSTPYSCPASGTLAQAQELIIGWFAAASTATYTAGGGFTKNVQQSQSANASTSIASLAVSATTTQTPSWTGTAPTRRRSRHRLVQARSDCHHHGGGGGHQHNDGGHWRGHGSDRSNGGRRWYGDGRLVQRFPLPSVHCDFLGRNRRRQATAYAGVPMPSHPALERYTQRGGRRPARRLLQEMPARPEPVRPQRRSARRSAIRPLRRRARALQRPPGCQSLPANGTAAGHRRRQPRPGRKSAPIPAPLPD